MTASDKDSQPAEADVRSRPLGLSLVWLVPIVATIVGLSMLFKAWQETGPTIRISFQTAGSLTAEKSPIKYRNVVIGEVADVKLSSDHGQVIVTAKLNREAVDFTRQDSRYWVVRPRIGTEGISGLDTLLSGGFIAADPGTSAHRTESFTGLESPPPVTYGEPGKRFVVKAEDLGSLDIGSPIYYRKVRVGQLVSYELDHSGDSVNMDVFVSAPNDRFVTADTRFWNASGIRIGVSADGVEFDAESLVSVVTGGIAFATPPDGQAEPAETDTSFRLYPTQEAALTPDKGPAQIIRMHFGHSLRGLREGAQVDFKGKKIGEVTEISLDYDPVTETFPVIVDAKVYPQLIGDAYDKLLRTQTIDVGDNQQSLTQALFHQFVRQGLHAEARQNNLLTGQLYVALAFVPGAGTDVVADKNAGAVVEIPTQFTSFDKIQDQLTDIVDRLSQIPFDRIADNLNGSLEELKQTLTSINRDTLPSTRNTLQGIDILVNEMSATLQAATATFAYDSPERQRIGHTLNELERMSRSVRDLSDYLRRHPEALIRGRKEHNTGTLRP
ncbi:intermembrane transport protein PqiB [Marinobacter caseinilyticus]|uniref:PqiB family protein n=1 Tax=Marinobacter caseinilyticus TaxID=2692195 RepID=UPI00140C2B3C|nr:MlaD family protein [Marinobacter caseinilyticus]